MCTSGRPPGVRRAAFWETTTRARALFAKGHARHDKGCAAPVAYDAVASIKRGAAVRLRPNPKLSAVACKRTRHAACVRERARERDRARLGTFVRRALQPCRRHSWGRQRHHPVGEKMVGREERRMCTTGRKAWNKTVRNLIVLALLYCSAVLHLCLACAYMDADALLCTNQPAKPS
jgi:hypothetical protein